MKTRVFDWYEIGFLLVQGFTAEFEERPGFPHQIDALFDTTPELERAKLDFLTGKACSAMALREAVKHVARLTADHRRQRGL